MRVGIMGSWKQFRSRFYICETFSHCFCSSPLILIILGWLPFFFRLPLKNSFSVIWHHSSSCPRWYYLLHVFNHYIGHTQFTTIYKSLFLISLLHYRCEFSSFVMSVQLISNIIKISLILKLFAPSVFFISFSDYHLSFGYQRKVLYSIFLSPSV